MWNTLDVLWDAHRGLLSSSSGSGEATCMAYSYGDYVTVAPGTVAFA